ncbi:hypothetical protein FB45DRAFT_397486 [Roridomyces roridus]|uniref:MYND-type domain-containing protein n=1 Tax=Roridomyces roridus TaxID=1738132 RepID=A0AAD7FU35_9AGAR|nr:hypothetical protein FB45DRAFT_397486 [Roridomyces roridus]
MPKKKRSQATAGGALPTVAQLLATARSENDPHKLVGDISGLLDVSDVSTAQGLKECHRGFAIVCSKIDQLYMQTREDRWDRASADRLAAFILFTCGRIAQDVVLCKRIFEETRFLERSMVLLSSTSDLFVGEIVIKTLDDVTSHDNTAILSKAICVVPTVLDYAEAHRTQLRVECLEKVVFILLGSTLDVYTEANPNPELAALASIPRVVGLSLQVLGLPDSTSQLHRSFTSFCSMTAKHLGTIFLSKPDLINFLVAGTRSADYHTRCFAQSSLVQIYSETAWRDWKAGRGHLQQLNLGSQSFLAEGAQALIEFLNLVQRFDGSSGSQIGHALADFMQENPGVARRMSEAFIGRIPLCETALRRDGSTRAVIAADILRFELLLSRDEADHEACAFARSCMERHPSVAYFYHAMNTFPDILAAGPSAAFFAEKGLRCRPISNTIRRDLLALIATFLHSTVTTMLNHVPNADRLRKALDLVEKGLSRSSAFLDITPLDHPRAAEMSAIFALFNIMSKGDILTSKELESLQARFSLACEIARNNVVFRLPKECSALELIFAHMPTAWGRWGPIMSRTDSTEPRWRFGNRETRVSVVDLEPVTLAADPNDDHFLLWLENLYMATPDVQNAEILGTPDTARRHGEAGLYHCSACNSPNAALKRCSGCQRARYCNNSCQKSHWKTHRQVCKAK